MHEASSGILRIATANMAEAVKAIASESEMIHGTSGCCASAAAARSFGAFIMDELELPAAIVPVVPSVFSAWGMLMIDLQHDLVSTHAVPVSQIDGAYLENHFGALVAKGEDLLEREGVPRDRRRCELHADMRYIGQEHTVSVAMTDLMENDVHSRLTPAFEESYQSVYGYKLGLPAELVNLRIKQSVRFRRRKYASCPRRPQIHHSEAQGPAQGVRLHLRRMEYRRRLCAPRS